MDFRIQATEPTTSTNLKSVLEAARDKWLEMTPQDSHRNTPEFERLERMVAVAKNEARRDPHEALLAAIKARNAAGLDERHTAIVSQMNKGIAAAIALVGDAPVRVRIDGHVKLSGEARDGIYNRLNVHVDDAAHG